MTQEDFGIADMYTRAAGPIQKPTKATHESRQCRAFHPFQYTLGPVQRCQNSAVQHDGTCWEHTDYYRDWWSRHIPCSAYMADILLCDNAHEILYQLKNGYVSIEDTDFKDCMTTRNIDVVFIVFLCRHTNFNVAEWPGLMVRLVNERFTKSILHLHKSAAEAFAPLYSYIDRASIFDIYIQLVIDWVNHNLQGVIGPAGVFDSFLRTADVHYGHIVGNRQRIATYINVMRNQHISNDDDDMLYTACCGRYWMWVSHLKERARRTYAPLKEELMAASWAPQRMPYWCLDWEEVAEEYPEGLPSKAEHAALCKKIETNM
jgi:hypothetical protein